METGISRNQNEYMYDIICGGSSSRVERDVDERDEKEHIKILNEDKILERWEKLDEEFSRVYIMIKTNILGEEEKKNL